MGVLNCTPDSFSDGGRYQSETSAIDHAIRMVRSGASIVDVGAESTRPGSPRIDAAEQIDRLAGVIRRLAAEGVLVSIDTTLPEVAEVALRDGARMINSVALDAAEDLARLAKPYDADLCLMHSRGAMLTMQGFSEMSEDAYDDVVDCVWAEWTPARDAAVRAGLEPTNIFFDPGLGFHKNAKHSLTLTKRVGSFRGRGHPILVGPSRKSFLVQGALVPPEQRVAATIAACLLLADGGADVLRVHDVHEVKQALSFREATLDV